MRGAAIGFAALGVAVLALTWGTVATVRGWPEMLPQHVMLFVAAGFAWAAAVLAVRVLPRVRGQWVVVLLVALAMRVPAWWMEPAHSQDAYRFVWDGRVQRAGINPYLHAPDAPELASLRDESWQRINHRELPTIYPPGAQLAFRLPTALPLPPMSAWKLCVALFDLGLLALLLFWLGKNGGDARRAIAWGWSPLVTIELAGNAHLDGIGAAGLAAAVIALQSRWRIAAGLALALSASFKPLAWVLAPLLLRRGAPISQRLVAPAALVVVLLALALPYRDAGTRITGSLGEYGRRWRANDGAFALVHAGAIWAVAHSRFAQRYELGDRPRLARLVSGRNRDQIYPDEVANLLARVVVLLMFAAVVGWALWRRLSPLRVASCAIGAFVLLTPTLHPWYVVFVLPLEALGATPAWLALAALVPLAYWPSPEIWPRAVIHGAAWLTLVLFWLAGNRLTPPEGPVISDDP